MDVHGELRIDPGSLDRIGVGEDLEIVVLHTEWSLTEAVLKRAGALTAGLNARIQLVAIHTVPYPARFECQATVHAHLVEQLVDLATSCPLNVEPEVVLARSREDGFRHLLTAHSTVLIGARQRLWRTTEESLARGLARDGYSVALIHID